MSRSLNRLAQHLPADNSGKSKIAVPERGGTAGLPAAVARIARDDGRQSARRLILPSDFEPHESRDYKTGRDVSGGRGGCDAGWALRRLTRLAVHANHAPPITCGHILDWQVTYTAVSWHLPSIFESNANRETEKTNWRPFGCYTHRCTCLESMSASYNT